MWLFVWDNEPSKIFVGDTQASKVFVWDTQVRPSYTPRTPDASRTLLYMKFNNNLNDDSGNGVSVSGLNLTYWTEWNNSYVQLTSKYGVVTPPWNLASSIGTGDFTVSSFFYAVDTTHTEPAWVFGDWYDWGYPRPWICVRFKYDTNSSTNYFIAWMNDGVGTWAINAECTINTRHHQVYVRRNWTVYWFLDGVKYWPQNNTINLSNVDKFVIIWRNDYSPQAWWQTWARTSEVILENVAWTDQEIAGYFNYQKWNYWIS